MAPAVEPPEAESKKPDSHSPERYLYISDFPSNGAADRLPKPVPLGEEIQDKDPSAAFRWYHVPLNDTEWIDYYLERISKINGKYDKTTQTLLRRTWENNERPAGALPEAILPRHCRFMEPSCAAYGRGKGTKPSNEKSQANRAVVSLFLPYLNWESFERLQNLHDHDKPDTTKDRDGDVPRRPPTLHQRRTLDQFYYPGLQDTRTRDARQTVSRWTGKGEMDRNGRVKAVPTSLVVMVDQMWVWVLDKETNSTDSLLSFFPSGNLQYHGEKDTTFADLYGSVSRHSKECHDAYDFASLLVKKSIKVPFEQKNKKFADLLGIYQWAAGNKAAQQAEEFENFHQGQLGTYSPASSSDNGRELSLIREVADIQDELNMLAAVLEKQSEVVHILSSVLQNLKVKPSAPPQSSEQGSSVDINSLQIHDGHTRIAFAPKSNGEVHVDLQQQHDGHLSFGSRQDGTELISGIGGKAGAFIQDARDELRRVTSGVRRLKADAETTHKMLLDQLDLKQKAASLEEARSTTKQGRVVMLFTVITIVFLPLSFFTSYFGQNVSEITGDSQNPTSADLWKIGGPISVMVILCALLVAYYITNPESRFWIRWKKRNNKFKV